MPKGLILTKAELDLIHALFHNQLPGQAPSTPIFNMDGGPQANDLLMRLSQNAQLSLEVQLNDCRMIFPLTLIEDELHNLQLEMSAPRIFEENQVRRPWRLELDEPLPLRNGKGAESDLLVHELATDSLVLSSATVEPPDKFNLWLHLPGFDRIAIKGQRLRRIDPHRSAYYLELRQEKHAEHIRQFIFEQYRQSHPHLQMAS